MKSTNKILAYIDDCYKLYIERPQYYFGSPAEMEAALIELEQLYEFIIGGEEHSELGYYIFLRDHAYGAARFTTGKTEHPSLFSAMAGFWREYLASGARKRCRDAR